MTRGFTGWHMTGVMCAFFGVVITVNVFMAAEASRTFGGSVVENSYVASQQYNRWLAEARDQAKSKVVAHASAEPGGILNVSLRGPEGPLRRAVLDVRAEHPLGRVPGRDIRLSEVGNGVYSAGHGLPPGRWRLTIEARSAGRDLRFEQDVRL